MHPSRAHDRIMTLIKDTTTNTLKKKLREDDPRAAIPERTGNGIDFQRFVRSPKTGESVKRMIKKELNNRRKNNMTKFTEVDKNKTEFRQLNEGEVFILFGVSDVEEMCVKKDEGYAIDLDQESVRCVDPDAEVQRVELVEVKYKT